MKSESNKPPPKIPRDLESTESIADGHIISPENAGMKKTFSFLGILALGFNISNSWVAIATSLALSIASGGTVTILYGILVVGFAMICTGLSLAELASVYPTAGGQYHLTSILAPERFSKGLSYTCGMLGVFSWISIGSSIALIVAQAIMALVIQYHPDLSVKTWHYFLLYVAVHGLAVLYNLFLAQKTEWIYKLTFTSIACPARTNASVNSSFVWTTFYNNSKLWPDGICFLTGLSGPSFMLIGLDATMHLAEECSAPARIIPKAIVSTVLVGVVTAFVFAVAMCYSTDNFESLLATPTGFPIYALWHQATRSLAGATILMLALLCIMVSALNAVHQTASRLTWSFARDDAILLSKYLKLVHPRLHMPVYALLLNFVFCVIAGALYPASSSGMSLYIISLEMSPR
ncbi:choline transport [Fusarium sporotrichioides]|uniref:Choline transport n=1 Tax=Fusarium sporotrichioides TaxID=5514 RepID=A0A395RUA4_FUSSP|nr:choline transport [Fusarium sporotrichioides]